MENKPKKDTKANTTSSLFIGSTLSNPNIKSIIQAVATILQSQILEVCNYLLIFNNFYRISKKVEAMTLLKRFTSLTRKSTSRRTLTNLVTRGKRS